MTAREEEKFVKIVTAFPGRHMENSTAFDGIDLWHQEIVMAEAPWRATWAEPPRRCEERVRRQIAPQGGPRRRSRPERRK